MQLHISHTQCIYLYQQPANHFHLLLYQREVDSINYFMRSLATKYAMYFNQKYKRVGHLFESIYKAVEIETDEQLVNLSKYIHRNPAELLSAGMILEGYKYSSYGNYLRLFSQTWVKPNKILSLIKGKSYKKFVEVSKQEFSENIINLVFDDLQG